MNLDRRLRCALSTLLACTGLAQAAPGALRSVDSLPEATRPAGVPSNYVITPNGYFHPSCVVQVGEDDELVADGSVRRADGSLRPAEACGHASFDASGRARTPVTYNGWIAYSDTDPSVTPVSNEMTAQWVVPSGPTHGAGQTLYFFPGLEQSPGVITILQPVLAWNGYGDSTWTMTNWNCCHSGSTYHGPRIPVSTGDQIKGTMKGTCKTGAACSTWKITSEDASTGQSTTFKTSAFGQAFNWWFGGAMETYGVLTCDQFPADGRIAFTHIKTYDASYGKVTPAWFENVDQSSAPSCNYKVDTTTSTTTITFTP